MAGVGSEGGDRDGQRASEASQAHPLTPTAHEALSAHVKRWQEIHAGTGADTSEDMPLCNVYLDRTRKTCPGCPVSMAGHDNCWDTPMEKFFNHHYYWHWKEWEAPGAGGYKALKKIKGCKTGCNSFAEESVNFLKSLLPNRVK